MDSQQRLQERIYHVLKPWLDLFDEPPFSEEQLVVMALAHEAVPMTAKAIHDWILERLPYYSKLARECMWAMMRGDSCFVTWSTNGPEFRRRFNTAFFHLEVPLIEVKINEVLHWTVLVGAARIYLNPILANIEEADAECFPFLRLPYELRLRIYEMVFVLPAAGVRLMRDKGNGHGPYTRITTVSNDLLDVEAQALWFNYKRNSSRRQELQNAGLDGFRSYECLPPSKMLAPLLTCRIINEEATPIFFELNPFVFMEVNEMFDFLHGLSEIRRKYVRHILLDVSRFNEDRLYPADVEDEPEGRDRTLMCRAQILDTCIRLVRLDIFARGREINQGWFSERPDEWRKEVRRLIRLLRSQRRCQVRVGGECPTELETAIGQDEEYAIMGRDMICS